MLMVDRYSAGKAKESYSNQGRNDRVRKGVRNVLGISKIEDYSPSEIEDLGRRYIQKRNINRRSAAAGGVLGALAVGGYLNSEISRDIRETVKDGVQAAQDVHAISRYFSSIPLSRRGADRYLGLFSPEFREGYSSVQPSTLNEFIRASRAAMDASAGAAGKTTQRIGGSIGRAVDVAIGTRSLTHGGGKKSGTEYSQNYNRTTDALIAGIQKLSRYDSEIKALTKKMAEREEKEGAGNVREADLEQLGELCSEKIVLWKYLNNLPQSSSKDSLTAEEISQGRANARYEEQVVKKPAEMELKKNDSWAETADVSGMLLVGALGAYVGARSYKTASKIGRAVSAPVRRVSSSLGKLARRIHKKESN